MIKAKGSSSRHGGQKNFDLIFQKLPGISFWISETADINQNIFFSENITILTGYSAQEINSFKGKHYSLIDKEEYLSVRRQLDDFFDGSIKDALEVQYTLTAQKGKKIFIKENIQKERGVEGEINYYYASLTDLTSTKENENLLHSKMLEAKRLNEAKDSFISLLSHDLRSPFTSILGFAEILMNENSLSAKDRLEYLTFIYDSSLNQLQLINNLLDWSRLSTGRLKLQTQRLHAKLLFIIAYQP
ncbi:MAG: hypothetical protein IPM56_16395 [Ignavibacteriales bacterium]|nr:MAG: hypothetical protein IPM56_16395 [Ignavibacteriales bacterium]